MSKPNWEAIAEAAYASYRRMMMRCPSYSPPTWRDLGEHDRESWVCGARAAAKAFREQPDTDTGK